jgi:hypothetical protein
MRLGVRNEVACPSRRRLIVRSDSHFLFGTFSQRELPSSNSKGDYALLLKTIPNIEGHLLKGHSERWVKRALPENGSFAKNERHIWGVS